MSGDNSKTTFGGMPADVSTVRAVAFATGPTVVIALKENMPTLEVVPVVAADSRPMDTPGMAQGQGAGFSK
jgi:hypothetical protein